MESERESNSQNPDNAPRRTVRRVVRQRQPSSRIRIERDDSAADATAQELAVAHAPETVEETGPRLCPFCQQEVSLQAVVCRHCGRDLVAANGARLALAPEAWNMNVPPWMLEQEQQYLKRRDYSRLIQSYWPKVVLGLVGLLVLAIIIRLFTAPQEPTPPTGTARLPRNEAPVSSLDMESADKKRAPQATPTVQVSVRSNPASVVVVPAPVASPETPSEFVEVLEVKELVRQFALDHAQADDKFKDKLVRLTGNIKTVDTSAAAAYVVLDTPSDIEVRCYLGGSALSGLTRLHPGTQVTLQGRCQGWFNNIVVSDCELR